MSNRIYQTDKDLKQRTRDRVAAGAWLFVRLVFVAILGIFSVVNFSYAQMNLSAVTLKVASPAQASTSTVYVRSLPSPGAPLSADVTVTGSERWRSTRVQINGVITCVDTGDFSSGQLPQTQNAAFNAPVAEGTYNVTFTAFRNAGCANTSDSFTINGGVVVDGTAPTVTSLNRVSATPTTAATVDWIVTFSEPVVGVTASNFSLTGTGASGASIAAISGTGNTRTVTVNTGDNGALQLNLAAVGTLTDRAGNPLNLPSTVAGQSYTVNRVLPVATITCGTPAACGTANPTSDLRLVWNVSFSTPVTGVAANNFTLTGTGIAGAQVTSVTGSGTSWVVTVTTGVDGTHALNLNANRSNIQDASGASPSAVMATASNTYTVSGKRCTSAATGNWNVSTTWRRCAGGIPLANDTVTVIGPHNVTLNVNTPSLASLTIESGAILTNTASSTITVAGDLSNAGTYTGGAGAVSITGNFTNTGAYNAGTATTTLQGNFSNSGTFTGTSSSWIFSGNTAQTITGSPTYSSLTVNKPANAVTLSSNVTTASLTLTNGAVTTGANILTTTGDCQNRIFRTAGYVDGKLRLTFPSGTNISCTYHVGSNNYYAPIGAVITSAGGTLTGWTTSGEHPNISTSGVDPTKNVNRYWSLRTTGDAINVTNHAVTFNFQAVDVDDNADWSSFGVGRYTGATWSKPADVVTTVSSAGFSNAGSGLGAVTDFVVGEGAAESCSVPAGFNSCVCDNFGRATLNPSTIFGSDWVVTNSGGTFGNPRVFSGALRLTDGSSNAATAATVPGSFPAAGNNITVEFRHYAYGGSNPGADGIALTLSDASTTPNAGTFGGSLGYAQKCQNGVNGCVSDCARPGGCPGFNGGWLGVGIDEWGNFAQGLEGRIGGIGCSPAPTCSAQSVALRGSGPTYRYLATSGPLSPAVDNPTSAARSRGYLYRITVDATNYTWNGTTGNKTTLVRAERDVTGTGASYVTLPNLNLTNIFSYNTGQANVPTNWKLSFTGSTGGAQNIHEIKGLKVCSTFFTPPGSFGIQVNSSTGLTCATPGGTPSTPIVTVTARDSQGNYNAGYVGTINLTARAGSTTSTTATWRKVGSTTNILNGGTYTFTAADQGIAQFYLSDTAAESLNITVSDLNASTTSPTPVVFSSTAVSFSIEEVEKSVQDPTKFFDAIAGRPHLMKVTYYSGCGATAVAGSKAMSGWYTPDASDPGADGPRMCPAPAGTPTSCLPDGSPQTCSNPRLTTSPPSSSNLTLNFNGSSSAYFCLKSTDVGKYYPQLRETAVPTSTTSSAPLLTVRPFAVVVSDIKQGSVVNPGTSANGGSAFATAGTNFETTVGAYLWSGAADTAGDTAGTIGDGRVNASATLGQVTSAGLAPSYSGTVQLKAIDPFGPVSPPGIKGTLTGGEGVIINAGSNTQMTMAYSEVGTFSMDAVIPTQAYLNTAGVNLNSRVAIFASGGSGSTQNRVVGRFKPHHFALEAGSTLSYGCDNGASSFTYQGQPFNVGFSLAAQNLQNEVVRNYGVAGYAPTLAGQALSLAAENNNDGVERNTCTTTPCPPNAARITPSLPAIPVNGWNQGKYIMAPSTIQFNRLTPATEEAPWSQLAFGLKVLDSVDGIPLYGDMNSLTTGTCTGPGCTAATLGGTGRTTNMLYGRLRIDNGYGSELLALPVSIEAQYWNGSKYVRNQADKCTPLTAVNYSMTNYSGNPATGTGITSTNLGMDKLQGVGTLAGGIGRVKIGPPSPQPTVKGSVTLNSAIPYLPGFGRETFGVYKSGPVIYIRELY